MRIKTDLQQFYDTEAEKYYATRQKFRKEGKLILKVLEQRTVTQAWKKVKILEFWSGSGRRANYLKQHYTGKFSYIGVDISQELIKYAKQDNPKMKFTCEDISEFITRQQQESFDVVIGTASFQHIPSFKERLFLMKHFYRVLTYDGIVIMTNWSYSIWFLKRFWKEMLQSVGKWMVSGWKDSRRDIFLPWTNKGKTKHRYYHILGLKELKKLTDFSGLGRQELCYIDSQGKKVLHWKYAKNSLLVAKKSPIEG